MQAISPNRRRTHRRHPQRKQKLPVLLTPLLLFSAFFGIPENSAAQIRPETEAKTVSATVWVYTEQTPGNTAYVPEEELQRLARFVLSGMVFGWRFDYTPADSARRVSEYFSLVPIAEIPAGSARLSFSCTETSGPRQYCRAEYIPDAAAANGSAFWNSVLFRSCKGRGSGERIAETGGIFQAYENAVKNAVHEYARTQEKNKPKEIRGEIKFKQEPRLFTDSGRFVVDAEFLIHIRETVPYTVF